MKLSGWLLITLGLILAFVAILLPTSVPTDGYEFAAAAGLRVPSVTNLGLMQRQMIVLQIGLAAFLGGCVLLAAGYVIEAMAARPGAPDPAAGLVIVEQHPEVIADPPASPPEVRYRDPVEESEAEKLWVRIGLGVVFAVGAILLAIALAAG